MTIDVKGIFMAGFHFARNYARDDYSDENCYQQWLIDCAPIDMRRLAFLKGAKFWEYKTTNGTMWQSDQKDVWDEACRRYPDTHPNTPPNSDYVAAQRVLVEWINDKDTQDDFDLWLKKRLTSQK